MNTFDVRISDTDYFGPKIVIEDSTELVKFVNTNPDKFIRIDSNNFRVLLRPEDKSLRIIEGVTNLNKLYEIFNNINNKFSSLMADDKGPGGIYVNRETYRMCH